MRKNVFGRRFKRDKDQRRALFKSLISSLVLSERIKTTEAKAKAIRGDAEKAVTKAKKNKELARRLLSGLLNKEALNKLLNDLAPRFANRNGGYTRILRVGRRFGDDAMEVMIEWTEAPKPVVAPVVKEVKKETTKEVKSKKKSASVKKVSKPKKAVKEKKK